MKVMKYFVNFDKGEKWLRDMGNQGYQLEGKSFLRYSFQKTESQDTIIKIDYRSFKSKTDFIDYCTLFEDSGWKHIAGNKNSGAQYFKKVNASSSDDIFSDTASKAGKYDRFSKAYLNMAIVYLPLFVALIVTDSINIVAFINPKQLFFTQGLWEMSGVEFWRAFLFEFPFALIRGVSWLFLPVAMLLFILFGFKAKQLYNLNK